MNEYDISELDLSTLKDFIIKHGHLKTIHKKEFFVQQNFKSPFIGFIKEGMFRYTRINKFGKEHIVGFSFKDDFIGEYSANICNRKSFVNIQAITESKIYILHYSVLKDLWNSSIEYQRLGRLVAEQLFIITYRRLIENQSNTPEERYSDFMRRYPAIKEAIPLKEIASFLGVTPETVSHIRKKLLDK